MSRSYQNSTRFIFGLCPLLIYTVKYVKRNMTLFRFYYTLTKFTPSKTKTFVIKIGQKHDVVLIVILI